jgi:inward rectifier potassium channel
MTPARTTGTHPAGGAASHAAHHPGRGETAGECAGGDTPAVIVRPKPRRRAAGRKVDAGTRSIVTKGLPRRFWSDLYHLCMTLSWPGLFGLLGMFYLCVNFVFATLYALSPGCIANLDPPGYLGYFFFSVETSATVGYGDMHPQTPYAHWVSILEIFAGVMSMATITGVIFARFSRPRARVMFADYAVIRPIEGRLTLMMRAANARQNVILEAEARVRLTRKEVTAEGYPIRRIHDLKLLRDQTPMFLLGWNLMHVIDESSPLAGETLASLRASNANLVLTMTGTDETTGQNMLARTIYTPDALRWNHTFRDIIVTGADGVEFVDYANFHQVVPLGEGHG